MWHCCHSSNANKVQVECFIFFSFAEAKASRLFSPFFEGMKGCPQKLNGHWLCRMWNLPHHHASQQHRHCHQQCRLNVFFPFGCGIKKPPQHKNHQTPQLFFLPLPHWHPTSIAWHQKHNHHTLAPRLQVDCIYFLKNVALKAMPLDRKKGTGTG